MSETSVRNHSEYSPATSKEVSILPDLPSNELMIRAGLIETGLPETSGATPLDAALAYEQQIALFEDLQKLVSENIPEGIPEEIATYMLATFYMRFWNRGVANHENYLNALHDKHAYTEHPHVVELIERAETAEHVSPAELLFVREILGIHSVELACLTHPYGKRIEELEPMRQSVGESIILLDGQIVEQPKARYKAKGMGGWARWEDDFSKGIFITRKRDMGILPDGTVVRERSSFILNCDPHTLPEEILEKIRQLDSKSETWEEDVIATGALDELCEQLLADNEFTKAIPVSTTIYAYNETTGDEIRERAEQARQDDMRLNAEKYPALYEAMQSEGAINQGENMKSFNDLFDPAALELCKTVLRRNPKE